MRLKHQADKPAGARHLSGRGRPGAAWWPDSSTFTPSRSHRVTTVLTIATWRQPAETSTGHSLLFHCQLPGDPWMGAADPANWPTPETDRWNVAARTMTAAGRCSSLTPGAFLIAHCAVVRCTVQCAMCTRALHDVPEAVGSMTGKHDVQIGTGIGLLAIRCLPHAVIRI